MKVDFENKIIEIEFGDTFTKLKELVEKHNLENFALQPKQTNTFIPYSEPLINEGWKPNNVFYTISKK